MAPYDPHSTRKKVALCIDCHGSIKRLGLGEGNAQFADGRFKTWQIYDSKLSGLGDFSLETMISERGKMPQKMSRLTARPFSLDEINKIYRVSLCITCHDSSEDKIYANFEKGINRYLEDKSLACWDLK
jgi:cytochrome c553